MKLIIAKRRIRRPPSLVSSAVTSNSSSSSSSDSDSKDEIPSASIKTRETVVSRTTPLKKKPSRTATTTLLKKQAQDRSDQTIASTSSSSSRFRLRSKTRGAAAAAGIGSAVAASNKKSTKIDKSTSDGYKVRFILIIDSVIKINALNTFIHRLSVITQTGLSIVLKLENSYQKIYLLIYALILSLPLVG